MQPVAERPGMRAQLRGGGPERVGGLLRMTALNAAAATRAMTDADPEAGHHRDRVGQLGLELLSPPVEHHPAPAVRAAAWQRRLQLPIDTARNDTVTVTAMRLTRFPAWRPRLQHWVSLRKRGRLPLPPPAQLLNENLKLPQPLVLLSHLRVTISQLALKATHPQIKPNVLRFKLLPSPPRHDPGLTHRARNVVDPHAPRDLPRYRVTARNRL